MTTPELTLNKVKKTITERNYRVSDFLTTEEIEEVHESNRKGKKLPKFDLIDSYAGEILARFGYGAYLAWKNGEIEEGQMMKYVLAERSRDARERLVVERILVAAISGANHPAKGGHAPKTLKTAFKLLKEEEKNAKGGN